MDNTRRRCNICRTNKGKRYCLRNNKHICWSCCNSLRIDVKCPPECDYRLAEITKPTEIPIKTDCLSEFYDFLDKHTQFWLTKESPLFGGKIPMLMKDTPAGRNELIKRLSTLKLDKHTAKTYEKHLQIDLNSKEIPYTKTFEDIAIDFLTQVAEQNWQAARSYLAQKDPITIDKIIERLQQRKEILDMTNFTVISSGASKDGEEAFCSVETNHKYDISLLLVRTPVKAEQTVFAPPDKAGGGRGGEAQHPWIIDNILFGEINLLYSEPDSLRHIAYALSKEEYDKAWQFIKKSEDIYYLSPDIQYYKGLYLSLKNKPDEALKAYQESAALDTHFVEAYYNQAVIYHTKNDIEKAENLYHKIIALNPNYINAINNLGTIYLYHKKYDQAKESFERCLQINPDFQLAIDNLKKLTGE